MPVSNINHDGSNKIKLDDDTEVEITLGRYTFNTSTGAETKVQYGSEYAATSLSAVNAGEATEYKLSNYYYELTDARESNKVQDATATNATAKDLASFVASVSINKGYYLARYEASYASGNTVGVGKDSSYYKPASKVTTAYSINSMKLSPGTLWNFVSQATASKASRQMYYGDEFVESDLCNSYAWDTAIVYIQKMGNTNYSHATCNNTSLLNTGKTGDQKCKIYDMASNLREWTTEYSMWMVGAIAAPCVARGSRTGSEEYLYTKSHYSAYANTATQYFSFRPLLYCKII